MALPHSTERALLRDALPANGSGVQGVAGRERSVGVVCEEGGDIVLGRSGEDASEIVVQGVLVLLEPTIRAVLHPASIVVNDEALLEARGLILERPRMWFLTSRWLASPYSVQLVSECAVSRLRHDTLLVQQTEHTNRGATGFDEVDRRLQVETEVHVVPLDTLSRVLLLLQDEHVVVEELLELLVCVVDEKLLIPIDVEDLEASDIKDTDECGLG